MRMKRDRAMRVRLSDAEMDAVTAMAQVEDVCRAEAMRMALRESVRYRGLWPPRQAPGECAKEAVR